MIQIFHNSRCGKSRECLVFLEDSGKEYEIIKCTSLVVDWKRQFCHLIKYSPNQLGIEPT